MKVIRKIEELRELSIQERSMGKIVSLVPTMGYLHEGHTSLIKQAKLQSDIVITTLFVNPKQFAPHEDYDSYPRDFEHDYNMAKTAGSDILFAPSREEMYSDNNATTISIGEMAYKFEGQFRPHFFDGVATVVAKLFNASLPNKAFFGQKDYQQSLVIKKLSSDLNFDIDIVVCPIIRESNGLAMSSRNKYLTPEEKDKAKIIFQSLVNTKEFIEKGEKNRKKINAFLHENLRKLDILKIDYAIATDANTMEEPLEFIEGQKIVLLVGAILSKTRLIDNMVVSVPESKYNADANFTEGI